MPALYPYEGFSLQRECVLFNGVIEKGKDWPMVAPHQLVGTRIAASLQFSIFSMENTICPARYPLLAVLFCLQTFITQGLPSL